MGIDRERRIDMIALTESRQLTFLDSKDMNGELAPCTVHAKNMWSAAERELMELVEGIQHPCPCCGDAMLPPEIAENRSFYCEHCGVYFGQDLHDDIPEEIQ